MPQQPIMAQAAGGSAAQGQSWVSRREDELEQEVALFATQLAALEQEHLHCSWLGRLFGRAFGSGPTGKLERARFKLAYKREQLAQFQALHLQQGGL